MTVQVTLGENKTKTWTAIEPGHSSRRFVMKMRAGVIFISLLVFCSVSTGFAGSGKTKILVVSSYHPEYLWSQDTQAGVCAALLDFKFLDHKAQTDEYTRNDFVETDKTVVKKVWMDTKRKSAKNEIAEATARIVQEINEFKPDLILLGDDNAANYIGGQFIDTEIPVVFWGVNLDPTKYGLIESMGSPGHNVTGIYQSGYLKESLTYLKKLVPDVSTFAVLSDDSETGRAKAKEIESLSARGELPLKLTAMVVTNLFSEWQAETLALLDKTDSFFVVNHNTLKNKEGKAVDPLEACAWYLKNIKKPDCADEKQFIREGILITTDDSGFKQGYEAVRMAHLILHEGKNPANIPVIAPERGPIIVNRQRAEMLGIDLSDKGFIEEYVDKSLALEKYPA